MPRGIDAKAKPWKPLARARMKAFGDPPRVAVRGAIGFFAYMSDRPVTRFEFYARMAYLSERACYGKV